MQEWRWLVTLAGVILTLSLDGCAGQYSPPTTASILSNIPMATVPTDPLPSNVISGTSSQAVVYNDVVSFLTGLPTYGCKAVQADGLCQMAGGVFAALCPVYCGQSFRLFDSCLDRDAEAIELWSLVPQSDLFSANTVTDCATIRKTLSCGDLAFAALCPTTCGVCANGVHPMTAIVSGASDTELSAFDAQRQLVLQEIREMSWDCAAQRRDANYECGSEKVLCPSLP
eukprot:m.176755 g.176755  ORF g.176755 m.176755 type:complete len:228 (-) comp17952_c3_seq1:98-781(-)